MISEIEHSIARINTTSINIMDIVRIFMRNNLLYPLTLKSKRRLLGRPILIRSSAFPASLLTHDLVVPKTLTQHYQVSEQHHSCNSENMCKDQ